MDGGDLGDGDALLIAAEPARLHAADPLRADDKLGGEEEVALGPTAGGEGFGLRGGGGGHPAMVRRGKGVSTTSTWLENWGTSVPGFSPGFLNFGLFHNGTAHGNVRMGAIIARTDLRIVSKRQD